MIPISITIKGFGPHLDTHLDYSSLASPIAIVAPYGTGKTFLIECITAALFSQFAWYGGSIYDALTQNGTGEGSIELVFEHGGKRYLVIRKVRNTGKTQSQSATLTLLDSDNTFSLDNVIAGPKVTDFDRAITALIGDRDTAFSTWFLSQNRRNDLCGQPGEQDLVARRRGVFNELIGAGDLDEIEARAADRMKFLSGQAHGLETMLAGDTTNYTSEIEWATQELIRLEDQRDELSEDVVRAESDLEAARRRLRDAEGGDETLRAQVAAYDAAVREVQACRLRVNTLEGEVARLTERAAGLEQAVWDENMISTLKARRGELQERADAYQMWKRWDRERVTLMNNVANLEQRLADLEAIPGVDEATRALAGRCEEIRQRGQAEKAENEARTERNKDRAKRRAWSENRAAVLTERINDLKTRYANKPVTPFGEQCSPCELMRGYFEIPSQISENHHDLEKEKEYLSSIEPDEPLTDLSDLRAEYERALAAKRAVEAAAESVKTMEAVREQLTDAQSRLTAHKESEPEYADDPTAELRTVQAEIDALGGAAERVRACEQAAADLEQKQTDLIDERGQLNHVTGKMDQLKPGAESAAAALRDREAQRESLTQEVQRLARVLSDARNRQLEIGANIGDCGARISELERRRDEAQERRERLTAMNDELDGLKDLRACFGPRGVRQILIDDAAPALEEIADDLFERATGGRMRLRISTQKVNRDQSTAEDFSIMVRDERGERDATRFSGGQLQLIQILFRISVALWVGRIRGHRADCLFLDEAFDRLGAEGTEDLLRVLDHLAGQIQTIVVVTHDQLIAERLRSMVRLRRGALGVAVEVVGAGVTA